MKLIGYIGRPPATEHRLLGVNAGKFVAALATCKNKYGGKIDSKYFATIINKRPGPLSVWVTSDLDGTGPELLVRAEASGPPVASIEIQDLEPMMILFGISPDHARILEREIGI